MALKFYSFPVLFFDVSAHLIDCRKIVLDDFVLINRLTSLFIFGAEDWTRSLLCARQRLYQHLYVNNEACPRPSGCVIPTECTVCAVLPLCKTQRAPMILNKTTRRRDLSASLLVSSRSGFVLPSHPQRSPSPRLLQFAYFPGTAFLKRAFPPYHDQISVLFVCTFP